MRRMNWRDRRAILAAGLALAAAAAIGVTVSAQGRPGVGPQPTDEPWPSFTMVYRETAKGLGPNGSTGSQVFRVEYRSRRNWHVTLIVNTAAPDAVGSTWSYDGATSTFVDKRHGGFVFQARHGPQDALKVPADWLVPGRVEYYVQNRGWRPAPVPSPAPGVGPAPSQKGLAVARHEETLPDGKRGVSEITYRLDDGIPVRVVESVDGVEGRQIEALELTIGRR